MGGDFRPDVNIYKLFVWRPSPSLLCLQLVFMCVLSHRVAFLDRLQGDLAQSNCLQIDVGSDCNALFVHNTLCWNIHKQVEPVETFA